MLLHSFLFHVLHCCYNNLLWQTAAAFLAVLSCYWITELQSWTRTWDLRNVHVLFTFVVYFCMGILSFNGFVLLFVGDENCASVWSFSYASMDNNDDGVNANNYNSQHGHENLHQDPWVNHQILQLNWYSLYDLSLQLIEAGIYSPIYCTLSASIQSHWAKFCKSKFLGWTQTYCSFGGLNL